MASIDLDLFDTVDNEQPEAETPLVGNAPMTSDDDKSSGETEIHEGSSDVDSGIIEVSAKLTEKAETIVNFIEMCKSLGEGMNTWQYNLTVF